jgi:AraC-like DNA-binding protein
VLLRDGGQPIAAIARAVGIRDPRYFARIYRARFGTTPSAGRAAGPGGAATAARRSSPSKTG